MKSEHEQERVVILAAVDGTPASDAAIGTATALASSVRGAELHFVHVLAPPVFPTGPTVPSMPTYVEDARVFIAAVKRQASARFAGRLEGHLATGDPHERILAVAAELDADLIVIGSQGTTGIARWLHRSLAQRIASDAPCAVLIARPKEHSAAIPEIEPACPDCLDVQRKTTGTELWCAAHTARHPHGRLHYAIPKPFATGSMFFRGDS